MKGSLDITTFTTSIHFEGRTGLLKVTRYVTTYNNGTIEVEYYVNHDQDVQPAGYPVRELIVVCNNRLFFSRTKLMHYQNYIKAVTAALLAGLIANQYPADFH